MWLAIDYNAIVGRVIVTGPETREGRPVVATLAGPVARLIWSLTDVHDDRRIRPRQARPRGPQAPPAEGEAGRLVPTHVVDPRRRLRRPPPADRPRLRCRPVGPASQT